MVAAGLRILQVTPTYAPELGGVSNCAVEVARRLARRGADVEVLTVDVAGELAAHERLDGVPVRRVRSWPTGADYRFAPGLAAQVRHSDCDVLHVQCYQTLVAPTAMLAAARAGIPYVLTFHGGGHSKSWRNAIRSTQLRVLRPLLARAARLIATADWEVDYYAELLGLPRALFVTIPNGADLPPLPAQIPDVEGTLIASIGRVERYKGHHRVIEALPDVIRQVPDAHLWIAGDGPYADELMTLARGLGVADRVEIRAISDREEYAARLAGASLALLLSEFETHPMAAIEAITLGVPMLVADNSGLAELAQKGFARSVPLGASAAMHAAAMVDLIRSPPEVPAGLLMPSWDDCVDALIGLYGSLPRRGAGPVPRWAAPTSIDA
jgi:glycosyltransferase involved in cell wall biosynthesis